MVRSRREVPAVAGLASMRQTFGETIYRLAKSNPRIYVVNADLKSSLFLNKFANKYPKRFIECGVAEQNAAGVAAGLAKTGKTVFLTSFACFSPAINWAVIKQSIAYNNANVKIVGSHSGLMSGELGATHQMLEDVALMRTMPNMEVVAPVDAVETEKIVRVLANSKRPAYLRLVRPATKIVPGGRGFVIGKAEVLKKGRRMTILGYGPILLSAWDMVKDEDFEIINCSSIKPLDEETIIKSLKKTERCTVVEDHQKNGGLGEAVASLILRKGIRCKFEHLGVENKFGESARDYNELWRKYILVKSL